MIYGIVQNGNLHLRIPLNLYYSIIDQRGKVRWLADYAIIYRIHTDYANIMVNHGLVTWDDLNAWKMNIKELHENAIDNSKVLLRKYTVESVPDADQIETEKPIHSMYIISNQQTHLGASVILYSDVLEEIGKRIGEDYYLLPSSIHEWIICSAAAVTHQTATANVKEINEALVPPEIVLGDKVYRYNVAKKCIITDIDEMQIYKASSVD